jgi:EmrB/QacA subfamily drug resistance transporter
VLAALTLSVLLIALDGTIINVAMPTLATELGADSSQLQWIGGGYLLALSVAMLPLGLLGDRYGHKRLLVGGIVLFGIASLGGALADTPGEVIAARSVLGLAAAAIMPLSMAILPRVFSKEELPKAISAWTAATAMGMPFGPLIGGWLLNHFWYGSVFLFNAPVCALAAVAGLLLLPSDRTRERAEGQGSLPFDGLGTVLSALGIVALVYGTIQVPNDGWGSPQVLGAFVAAVVLLTGFVVRQRRFSHPLVDLNLFSDRRFLWGSLVAVFVNFAVMGILFVAPQLLESVLGNDSFGTGLRVLPLIGGLMAAAALSEALVPKLGARVVVPAGLVLLASGALLGALADNGDAYGITATWLSVTGLGFGLAVVPATSLVMSSLPAHSSGSGTSLLETLQQVGGTLGVAALGSLLSAGYLDRLSVDGLPDAAADAAEDSVTAANGVAAQLHDPALRESAHQAFLHGMTMVLVVCAVFSLLAAVLAAVRLPRHVVATADAGAQGEKEKETAAGDPATKPGAATDSEGELVV